MIAAWMIWSVAAGLLLAVAALAAEKLLAGGRRWVWIAAALGTVTLPLVRMLPALGGGGGGALPGGPVVLEPLLVDASRAPVFLGNALLAGWGTLSLAMAAFALVGCVRFRRRLARWERGALLGREVRWSRDTGPALAGLIRPVIVLPDWVREAGAARQELILAHEEEHLRARDMPLRLLAGLLLVAAPWNPALWFHYRRLGLAIELDCDRRVMNRLPERRRLYGDLLFRVGAGARSLPGLPVTALAERRSFLERRIRELFNRDPQVRLAQAAFLGFAAILVVAVTLVLPGISSRDDISREPTFVQMTVRPSLANSDDVVDALQREYPPLLHDAGVGGTAVVWLFIDEEGVVRDQRIHTSSGHRPLDEAALRVAEQARFTPALNGTEKVSVWLELPITFTTG